MIKSRIIIVKNYEVCDSFFRKLRGMMFRKKTVPLLFSFSKEKRISLHSLFCPGKMDIILLDKNMKVVEIKEGWRNWSFYNSKKQCKYLLELPGGSIAKSRTRLGDSIKITN